MPGPPQPDSDFYQATLQHLRDVVFRTDAEGRWDFLNPAWTDLTGFGVADSLGRPFLDYVHPDDRERNLAEFRPLVDGEKAMCRHEVRYLTADGGNRWVEVHARPVPDSSGAIAGTAGTLTDITERKALEASLTREKEQAQATLQSLGEGVIVTEGDGRIASLNGEAERLLGWSQASAAGRPLAEVFRVTDWEGNRMTGSMPGCVPSCTGRCSGFGGWLEKADGEAMAVDWSVAPVGEGALAELGCVVVFRDVTAQQTLQQKLAYQATHDDLTGMLNRSALQEAINHQDAAVRREGGAFSLVLFDLDQFKIVNDNYGHAVGDEVLVAMAARIGGHVREADWFGRWGGEEFLCLLPGTGADEAVAMAERVRADIQAHPLAPDGVPGAMTVSAGVAACPGDGDSGETVLRVADTRLYEAKRAGRNRVEAGGDRERGVLPMAGRLSRALAEDRILPAYQPIVDLATGEPVAEEALARLVEADGEVLAAGEFIEAATHLQMVHRIDEALLTRTMQRCSGMLQAGRGVDHFVNISTDLLRHRDRVDAILERALQICESCSWLMGDTKPIVIEITEREFVEDTVEVRRILKPFLDYGFRLAVDDFGSGYSSFRYLADLPVSFLKLEGTLVRRASSEPRVQAILRGIQDIAGELGLTTIAEMVEDQETADLMRSIGVDRAQGYHFARPALAE